jgi:hypothetical protein
MPAIFVILGLVALFILGIAAIYSYIPIAIGIVSFFIAALFWVPLKLRTDRKFREAVDLTSWPIFKWHFTFSPEKFVWPVIPLIIATTASLVALASDFSSVEYAVANASDWVRYPLKAATIGLCALTPAFLVFCFRFPLNIALVKYASFYLNHRFNRIRGKLLAIMDAQNRLDAQFEAMNIRPPLSARNDCRDFVLDNRPRA